MAQGQWRFFLGDSTPSSDVSKQIFAELAQARGRSLDLKLNGSGSAKFTYPLTGTNASDIHEILTCLIAVRDNTVRWSGPIMQVEEDLSSQTMSCTAVGWREELDTRFIRPGSDVVYSGVDSGQIALRLLDIANSQIDTSGTVRPTKITAGLADPCQVRSRTYVAGTNIGSEIQALSAIENGFDYFIDPVTRKMEIRYPSIGSIRPDIVFGYNWGPSNLSNIQISTDATALRNRHTAQGKYASGLDESATSMNLYGMREEYSSLTDVVDTTILGAYAIGEIRLKRLPRQIYTLSVFPSGPDNVPSLFSDYQIGDTVYVTARGGRQSIEGQAIRVFGATVSIDDEGNETISSLQTSPS